MQQYSGSYQQLIEKLDQFIRKYYVNKLIKGTLYTIGAVLGLFLLMNILEYYFYFGTGVRTAFYYGFIASIVMASAYWVVTPLIGYFRLGKTISHEDAAEIIGNHFGDVKDKLINVLQLKKQGVNLPNMDLVEASIEQKTNAIKLVPFKSAIDLSNNKQYLRYALPPFLLLIFILFAAPSIIREGTNRIVNADKYFAKAAPFSYLVDEQKLQVVQFQDYELKVQIEGSTLPNEVFATIDNFEYQMQKLSPNTFSYTFKNVQKDIAFFLNSGTVRSIPYTLEVLKKPNLSNLNIQLVYPSYLGRTNETLNSTGDVVVPEGTKMSWMYDTEYTDDITMQFGNSAKIKVDKKSNTSFIYSKKVINDESYKVYLSNKFVPISDSLLYNISVIKDQFPAVSAEKVVDSTDQTLVYFIGTASDDYGLNTLSFNYIITKANGKNLPIQTQKLSKPEGRDITFEHLFDIKKIAIEAGDKVSYYFEVYDNDGVNGSKSNKTPMMSYEKPTLDQLKMEEEKNDELIKDELKDALKDLNKLQDKMKKLKDKLMQEKTFNWQDKKEMEKILDEQKKIQDKIKEAKKKLEENMKNQEEQENLPEEIKKEQEKIKELMEKAEDPKTQELMDKIKELLQELDKEDAVQMLEKFEMNNESKEKEMDRMLQLYKQLEMEKDVKDQIKDLEKLAEEQEKLAEQTEKKEANPEELKKKQEELEKKLEELKKKQEELEKKNEELSPPKDMGEENKEKMDDAKKDMQDSKKELDKKDNKAASKSQKKAASKMKKQAKEMKESMEGGASDQASEDVKTLRQLLENLVTMSFEQEDLTKNISPYSINTPGYPEAIRKQFKLKGDFKVIEDTLVALSNRNSDIESFVMDKVAEIKTNLKHSIDDLEERRVSEGQEKQRRTMKNVNDLALMLNESLEKAQKDASGGMPGSQMCNKPGGKGGGKSGGKQPLNKITEGQQGLGEGLQKMKDKMGKGGKDGNTSKDFGEAAAKQSALRKALDDIQKGQKEQGKGSKELEEILKNMDKIETDLVNKRLNSETLMRMKDIETRLLEAEKAERQRELDNKRMSETAAEKQRQLPPNLQEYIKKRQNEIDLYKPISPSLKPYYKTIVDDYYKTLKSTNN